MVIIDSHTHAFPDFLAESAMEKLRDQSGNVVPPVSDGTVSGLLNEMDNSGVDISMLCSIATAPGQTRSIFIWSEKIKSERLIPLPSLHPDNEDVKGLVREVREMGMPGIKLHPLYQGYAVDDEKYFPIYEAAIEYDIAVEVHSGFDIGYPGDTRAHPSKTARVLDLFPGIRLFAAHYGGWNAWDAVLDHLAGRDVVFGLSFTFGYIKKDLFERIYSLHGPDRILFSTDSPWKSQKEELDKLRAFNLPGEDMEKILSANAERFFRLG